MLVKVRRIYGNSQPLHNLNHLSVPTEDTVSSNSELHCYLRIFNFAKYVSHKE